MFDIDKCELYDRNCKEGSRVHDTNGRFIFYFCKRPEHEIQYSKLAKSAYLKMPHLSTSVTVVVWP